MGKEEPEIDLAVAVAEAIPLTSAVESHYDPLKTGFYWYQPPLASEKEHKTGGHSWNIVGHDMQVLTMEVPPQEQVVTEPGSFMYMSPGMETKTEWVCDKVGCADGCGRCCGGEAPCKVFLVNPVATAGYVGITPNYPAKIIPMKFGTHIKSGSRLIAKSGAYMTELGDVKVGCDLDCSPATCCCAGLGCCRQEITGSDESIAFLAAGGTVVFHVLKEGETIIADTNSIVALEESVTLGIVPNGRCCGLTCCCGGEGLFSTTLTGPGRVYIQSMSFQKFAAAVQQVAMDDRDGGGGGGVDVSTFM
eukprot:Nitzschia sp. Nitz4//scaffold206_size41850//16184//17281//NITZ4_007420-RA/size41850-processed-gene-0.42-mRNA-1//1//CDS//3329541559//138//frame0